MVIYLLILLRQVLQNAKYKADESFLYFQISFNAWYNMESVQLKSIFWERIHPTARNIYQVQPIENDLQLGLSFSRAPPREPLPLAKPITSTSLEGWLLSRGGNDVKWFTTEQLGLAGMLKTRGRLADFSDYNIPCLSTLECLFMKITTIIWISLL